MEKDYSSLTPAPVVTNTEEKQFRDIESNTALTTLNPFAPVSTSTLPLPSSVPLSLHVPAPGPVETSTPPPALSPVLSSKFISDRALGLKDFFTFEPSIFSAPGVDFPPFSVFLRDPINDFYDDLAWCGSELPVSVQSTPSSLVDFRKLPLIKKGVTEPLPPFFTYDDNDKYSLICPQVEFE